MSDPMIIRTFDIAETESVVSFWEPAGLTRPWIAPLANITRKMSFQPDLCFAAVGENQTLWGTVMAGYDAHRGWLNDLATSFDARGTGIGRAREEHAELAVTAPASRK